MSTRIRLRRLGANKRPFYRVVVADQRSPRDGRFIENIGKYHPLEDPSLIEIDEERALHWLRVGAQPSNQVRNLMVKVGIWERFVQERPAAAKLVRAPRGAAEKPKLSKKAQAKAVAEAEAAAAPPEVEEEAPDPVEAEVEARPEAASGSPTVEAAEAPVEEAAAAPESVVEEPAPEVSEAPDEASAEEPEPES